MVILLHKSKRGNQAARDSFAALSGNQFDECQCQELMAYILERYANMRGTFLFVI